MIERNILSQKMKEFKIREFIAEQFMKTGYSHTKIQRTPLGDKITIYTTRPGLVVGRKGENIKKLTITLKNKFKLENPQIEIGEVEHPFLDAQSVAEKIAYSLERYGPTTFKSTGYRTLQSIMDAGALGSEIVMNGKIPSARSKTWRFIDGYLKKCGHISDAAIIKGESVAHLKAGSVGISVSIMPPGIELPDKITLVEQSPQVIEEETKLGDVEAETKTIMATKEKKEKAIKKTAKKKKKVEKKDENKGTKTDKGE
ncbi:MAG: 30S ribosomal protein S3 [Nanoarchaeota archaeon]|nr:30S ribosomal protein S3 [Nanoarchaeota archaeon]